MFDRNAFIRVWLWRLRYRARANQFTLVLTPACQLSHACAPAFNLTPARQSSLSRRSHQHPDEWYRALCRQQPMISCPILHYDPVILRPVQATNGFAPCSNTNQGFCTLSNNNRCMMYALLTQYQMILSSGQTTSIIGYHALMQQAQTISNPA